VCDTQLENAIKNILHQYVPMRSMSITSQTSIPNFIKAPVGPNVSEMNRN